MVYAAQGTWTSEGSVGANAEDAAVKKNLPQRTLLFFSARASAIASSNPSAMPPVVQFAMQAIAWCRGKAKRDAGAVARLRLVSQLPLGGKRSLALVEADGLRFLVGGSADSVTTIVPVCQSGAGTQRNAIDPQSLLAIENGAESTGDR